MSDLHIFGIRHHGPGCARALRAALSSLKPDILLLEGPPEGESVLEHAASEEMTPPVALMIVPEEEARRSVVYPFTEYSPEWQAIRYGFERELPVRFVDAPMERPSAPDEEPEGAEVELDPLGWLSRAAGYDDPELWWELQVERRRDSRDLFAGVLQAMRAVRKEAGKTKGRDARREAHMRRGIGRARAEGFERIAVVCGAWHGPALEGGPRSGDEELLAAEEAAGETMASWIPWSYRRLSQRTGYRAGIRSPGWYHHLWTDPDRAHVRWVAGAARLLRDEDLDASSADVIAAVRLAESLAGLRDLSAPGLPELTEAIRATFCSGGDTPMQLIRDRLEIGDRLGGIPSGAPTVPIVRDLEERQRALRMKPALEETELKLDLRKKLDRRRSHLLHRLALLDVDWGIPKRVTGRRLGTFHEWWLLEWDPAHRIRLVEQSVWGRTIREAATARSVDRGQNLDRLDRVTGLLDGVILANLPGAVDPLLTTIHHRVASGAAVSQILDAVPPLVRIVRYGDVRQTPTEAVLAVLRALSTHLMATYPTATLHLGREAAQTLAERTVRFSRALGQLKRDDLQDEWDETLLSVIEREACHPLLRGQACRRLFERERLGREELVRRARFALSSAVPPEEAVAWLEGLLRGSGLLLLHEERLWAVLDAWVLGLSEERFSECLPMLRRAFAGFSEPQRRAMGNRVLSLKHEETARPPAGTFTDVDRARADRVLPVLRTIFEPGGRDG